MLERCSGGPGDGKWGSPALPRAEARVRHPGQLLPHRTPAGSRAAVGLAVPSPACVPGSCGTQRVAEAGCSQTSAGRSQLSSRVVSLLCSLTAARDSNPRWKPAGSLGAPSQKA